jgi:hypothetical protein
VRINGWAFKGTWHCLALALGLLLITAGLSGCASKGGGYSEKEAEAKMTQYIQKKYDETPSFEWIRWYKKKNSSQGYYAKTDSGYYIRMNVFESKSTECMDTKEYPELAAAMKSAFADNPLSDLYEVGVNPISDASPEALWSSLKYGFNLKWNNDLNQFLHEQKNNVHETFLVDIASTPGFYVIIRPDSMADYVQRYTAFETYIAQLKETYPDLTLVVSVVPPTVAADALTALKIQYTRGASPDVVLDYLDVWHSVEHDMQKPVILPSDAAGVEGYISQSNSQDPFVANEQNRLTETPAPHEIISERSGTGYRAISPLYRLENIEMDRSSNLVLLFDLPVILKDYLAQHPDAQLGKDYQLLRMDEYGYVEPIIPHYDWEGFTTREDAVRYLTGEGHYASYIRYYSDSDQILFGELQTQP